MKKRVFIYCEIIIITLLLFSCTNTGTDTDNKTMPIKYGVDFYWSTYESLVAIGENFVVYTEPNGIFKINDGDNVPQKICSTPAKNGVAIFNDWIYSDSFKIKIDGSEFTKFDRDYPAFDGRFFFYTETNKEGTNGKLFRREDETGQIKKLWEGETFGDLVMVSLTESRVIFTAASWSPDYVIAGIEYECDKDGKNFTETARSAYESWEFEARRAPVYDGYCYYVRHKGGYSDTNEGIYRFYPGNISNSERITSHSPNFFFYNNGSIFYSYDDYSIYELNIENKETTLIYSLKEVPVKAMVKRYGPNIMAVSDKYIFFLVKYNNYSLNTYSYEIWRMDKTGTSLICLGDGEMADYYQ